MEHGRLVSAASLLAERPKKTGEEGGSLDFFVALVPTAQWKDFSATSVLLTKGRWALVQVSVSYESG